MAVSGGQVVVDIVANTASFTKGLAETEAGLVGLSTAGGRDASWAANLERNKGKVKAIGAEARDAAYGIQVAESRLSTFDNVGSKHLDNLHAHARRTHLGFLGLSSGTILGGAGLVVAAQLFKHLEAHLTATGDAAFTTGGRLRNAAAALTTLDVWSAVAALDVQKLTGSMDFLQASVNKVNKGGLRGNEGFVTHAIDSVASLIGVDRIRERQLVRLKNLGNAYADSINTKMVTALNNLKVAAIDTGDALAFGERGNDSGRGPGALQAENFNIKGGGNLTPKSGPGSVGFGGDTTTIHVHGVTDPKTVANHVAAHQAKKRKSNPRSRRGRVYNGLH